MARSTEDCCGHNATKVAMESLKTTHNSKLASTCDLDCGEHDGHDHGASAAKAAGATLATCTFAALAAAVAAVALMAAH